MATLPIWPPPPSNSESPAFDWIFEDPRSKTLLAEVEQVAHSKANVLITGETGTGKELIARHLHYRSARCNGPFVVVSCGAFSETLVDAELFGYESGAFAGAFGTQIGWFEAAHGGTIFLDEINDLPLMVQNKLLRVLQEHEIVRLGGRKPIPIDVRIVAAATGDLEEMVQRKCFRKDLYYRLNVVSLHVLTLRERPGDIVPLARYFMEVYSRKLGYPRLRLTPQAERLLMQAPWPGNVRELENTIHRTLLLCDGEVIDAADLRLLPPPAKSHSAVSAPHKHVPAAPAPMLAPAHSAATTALQQAIRQLCQAQGGDLHQTVEDTLLREVFHYCHYSQSETARLLGLSRNIVRARLIRLGAINTSRKTSVFSEFTSSPFFSNKDIP
ncbi:sigma-54 interaction domain-containing protein [Giesbergeria sinuosa]|uniref:Sigma-54 interaction domain-containing protein n=1 Tax=Giesbergeria sinuosa TaxID=80883 RepID=A0ABV9QEW1_9BURK